MFRDFVGAHASLLMELADVFGALIGVIFLAGVLISRYERIPLGEAIYFAFITAFTVGFGDIAPKSPVARIVTILVALLGVVLMGIVVAVAVHALDIVLSGRAV